jgi:hypothetical protein
MIDFSRTAYARGTRGVSPYSRHTVICHGPLFGQKTPVLLHLHTGAVNSYIAALGGLAAVLKAQAHKRLPDFLLAPASTAAGAPWRVLLISF